MYGNSSSHRITYISILYVSISLLHHLLPASLPEPEPLPAESPSKICISLLVLKGVYHQHSLPLPEPAPLPAELPSKTYISLLLFKDVYHQHSLPLPLLPFRFPFRSPVAEPNTAGTALIGWDGETRDRDGRGEDGEDSGGTHF
ncbi:uncharacterized protein MYCFIDRAFT_169059 [Pseudocercospora fijiensis CIRAD86]|uniref:Uncharacterized protein n=1 Tax=Pseudocercospora fijiensis (strain CIRAD86) TaxID=383855 RepID=N1Q8E2_PSEFD|nr:uncharacterized protein MYCFIDRAFT_169059 [Pseudocercospora fijiensis CIRAD86]EME87197.1 hypothetical protein MYCFIDRAFT_169059 [Pseudocercospora fijiensis CIRAD86]